MAKQTVEQLIEGGKATPGPPLGPVLGPLGLNIQEVINEVNKKTQDFAGMKVPIKIIVDTDTKNYEIKVGSPTASALIKKEAGIEKGSSNPKTEPVADLAIEQVIKIATLRNDSLLGSDNIAKVKEVLGTCQSVGVLVGGKPARQVIQDINQGMYKEKIISAKTELTEEERQKLEEEKERLRKEMEERRAEYEEKAKVLITEMEGQPREEIIQKLDDAEIPKQIYEPLLPVEEAKPEEGEVKVEEKKEEAPKEEKAEKQKWPRNYSPK